MAAFGGNYIQRLRDSRLFNDANLVGYWMLDGNSNDSKGSNNGTDTNITYGEGKYYKGAYFNGSTSHISVSSISHGTNNFAYSWWVKWTATPGSYGTYFEDGSWTNCVLIRQETTSITIYSMGSYYGAFSFNPTIGVWYHLTVTKNGSSLLFYKDGQYQSTIGSFTPNIAPSPTNLWFGASQHSSTQCMTGYMDDISIFSRTLTSDEVMEIYSSCNNKQFLSSPLRNDSSVIAYYRMEGDANDNKGNYNGSATNISYNASYGKFGQGASFNGSSSYINLGNFFNYQIFTIALWVNPGSSQLQYADIFDNNHTGTQNFVCQQNSTNTNQYSSGVSAGGDGSVWSSTDYFTLVSGIWTHLCFTFDGHIYRGYINGNLFSTGGYISSINYSSPYFRLGAWYNTTSRYWNGYMDDVVILNRCLSDLEVLSLFRTSVYYKPTYEILTLVTSANLTVTRRGTDDINIFKTSGSNAWDNHAYSVEGFVAPCTIEFYKLAAATDNGVSYAMMSWNADPTASTSYDTLDWASYPYMSNSYAVYHNGSSMGVLVNVWNTSLKFYIVYDTDGYIRHYNGSTLMYSVNKGTGGTVYLDSSFYSVNSTYGGFSNIRVCKKSWDGTKYV